MLDFQLLPLEGTAMPQFQKAPWLNSMTSRDLLVLNLGHDPTSLSLIQEAGLGPGYWVTRLPGQLVGYLRPGLGIRSRIRVQLGFRA